MFDSKVSMSGNVLTAMPPSEIILFDMDETIVSNAPVRGYQDAVDTILELKRRGYRLYPATTNARSSCITKLSIAGLADADGSPYFEDLFGGEEVCPTGKTGPEFFTDLLNRIGADPQQVVMVGDDPQMDLAHARAAGIEQVVLPRRNQSKDVVFESDGGIYVRSLTQLLEWLPPLYAEPRTA